VYLQLHVYSAKNIDISKQEICNNKNNSNNKNNTIVHIYKLCDKCITDFESIKNLGTMCTAFFMHHSKMFAMIQALTHCFCTVDCLLMFAFVLLIVY
jgi:hypothetical protein